NTPRVAFLPAEAVFVAPDWVSTPPSGLALRPLVVSSHQGIVVPSINVKPTTAWAAPTALLRELMREPPARLTLFAVDASLAPRGLAVGFLSAPAFDPSVGAPPPGAGPPRLRRDSTVLAGVPPHRSA